MTLVWLVLRSLATTAYMLVALVIAVGMIVTSVEEQDGPGRLALRLTFALLWLPALLLLLILALLGVL